MTTMLGALALLLCFGSTPALAGEAVGSGEGPRSGSRSSPPAQLLECRPAATNQESEARGAAERAGVSKQEVLARLIYSESLSTGYWNGRCQTPSSAELMTAIGWCIMNRVSHARANVAPEQRASAVPYYNVVFQRMQFRSSFSPRLPPNSGFSEQPFSKAFLCPQQGQAVLANATIRANATDLFAQASAIAEGMTTTFETTGIPPAYRNITNCFYPGSLAGGDVRQSWSVNDPANPGYMTLLRSRTPSPPACAEFYNLNAPGARR